MWILFDSTLSRQLFSAVAPTSLSVNAFISAARAMIDAYIEEWPSTLHERRQYDPWVVTTMDDSLLCPLSKFLKIQSTLTSAEYYGFGISEVHRSRGHKK